MTEVEGILWERLRDSQLDGLRFRRQHPLGHYIADFYCHELRLVIELDGGVHHEKIQLQRDTERDALMKRNGLSVLRFDNERILKNLEGVLEAIKEHANRQQQISPPVWGGARGGVSYECISL